MLYLIANSMLPESYQKCYKNATRSLKDGSKMVAHYVWKKFVKVFNLKIWRYFTSWIRGIYLWENPKTSKFTP